jgi:hypothetical protein
MCFFVKEFVLCREAKHVKLILPLSPAAGSLHSALIMKAKLSFAGTKRLVEFYYCNAKSPSRAMREFNTWALNNNIPTRLSQKNVVDAIKRFENATCMKTTKPHQ